MSPSRSSFRRRTAGLLALGVASALTIAGCAGSGGTSSASSSGYNSVAPGATAAGDSPASPANSPSATPTDRKVLLITEENEAYHSVIGDKDAPYLNQLATRYGLATKMSAGYPTKCPSLAAYILLTSGSTHGICDDAEAPAHQLSTDNLFQQVATSGREWRGYAQSMPTPCAARNSADHVYVVRHAPAPYYTSEAARCPNWDLPLGTTTSGALQQDVTAGTLPAFGFVTPDACHNMHDASACSGDPIKSADGWLAEWMPKIMAGPDYTAGKLVVIITWDEGTDQDNHIPAIVVSPATQKISSSTAWTHCSTLRTIEELLHLPLLGCAATAPSMTTTFKLDAATAG
jgi:hypothetical protein